MIRQLVLAVLMLAISGSVLVGQAAPAAADTQWFGNYEAKTYGNNWGNYPIGPIGTSYCPGGAWGGTYNATISVQKHVGLWRDAFEQTAWGWWDWVYKGYSHAYSGGYAPAETNVYHGRCTRASSNHDYWNGSSWTRLGSTSDGF